MCLPYKVRKENIRAEPTFKDSSQLRRTTIPTSRLLHPPSSPQAERLPVITTQPSLPEGPEPSAQGGVVEISARSSTVIYVEGSSQARHEESVNSNHHEKVAWQHRCVEGGTGKKSVVRLMWFEGIR